MQKYIQNISMSYEKNGLEIGFLHELVKYCKSDIILIHLIKNTLIIT